MRQDTSGQWTTDKGWKLTKGGKRAQHRFCLGFDRNAASLAENRLTAFWKALETFFAKEQNGKAPLFEDWSLSIAQQIADGKINVMVPDPPGFLIDTFYVGQVLELIAVWSEMLHRYFGNVCGFINVQTEPEKAYTFSAPVQKGSPAGQTLHGAIKAYVDHLHEAHKDANGQTNQTGKKQGERAIRLERHHQDCPLSALDARMIESILRYWSKRPLDAKGKRYSRDTCKNQLILIRAMLRWLHRSEIAWRLPPDFLFSRQKIEWLQEEISSIGTKKRTYTFNPDFRRA